MSMTDANHLFRFLLLRFARSLLIGLKKFKVAPHFLIEANKIKVKPVAVSINKLLSVDFNNVLQVRNLCSEFSLFSQWFMPPYVLNI